MPGFSRIYIAFLVVATIVSALSSALSAAATNSYIGAVVEHNVWVGNGDEKDSSLTAQSKLNYNLNIYSEHIKLAKSKGVQVVVFPEFGLTATGGSPKARSELYPFAVRIPSPSAPPSAPCDDQTLNNNSSSVNILYTMSCAARKSGILVLVNTIDWVDCESATDSSCPSDSHYQYNTDILFNENGEIVAKYHKSHEWPSFVGLYDQVPAPSQVTYTSSFGVTFGLFICFDIMFEDPPKVLRQAGVEHFLYAVAQGDAGLNTLIKDWSKNQKAVVLAANLGAGTKRPSSQDGSDCSGILVNGTILEASKYMLGAQFPDENVLVATIAI